MELSLQELYDFAVENKDKEFNIADAYTWLAAQCASQLSGQSLCMNDWFNFDTNDYFEQVAPEYGHMCAEVHTEWRKNYPNSKCLLTGAELSAKILQLMEAKNGTKS